MKQKVIFLISFVLLISIVGCTGKQDTLTFIYENTSLPNKECAFYEVDIGKEVHGATVVAELWQDGTCTKSIPLTLNNETETIAISLLLEVFETENNTKNLNVQIETDEASGSILTYFELPQEVRGYSFTAYKDKEVLDVNAGDEMILSAVAFDTGAGVRTVDCKSLIEETEKMKEYSCILVIRAAFTAEQIDPQSEESVNEE